jgi:hypothetical protein
VSNRYRVVRAPEGWPAKLPYRVGWPGHDGDYGIGDDFERDFSEEEEAANLDSGLLEIVPREYRVIGGSRVHETEPGDTFTRALRVGEEGLLFAGGHIERVEQKPAKTTNTKKEAKG